MSCKRHLVGEIVTDHNNVDTDLDDCVTAEDATALSLIQYAVSMDDRYVSGPDQLDQSLDIIMDDLTRPGHPASTRLDREDV